MPTNKQHIEFIASQGGETEFRTGWKGEPWSKAGTVSMSQFDRKGKNRLFGIEGWKKYSRHCVYHTSARYLSGYEDKQIWTLRVPGNIETVSDALEWVKPAKVKNAEAKGKKVVRQGDIFFIETARQGAISLPFSHRHIKSLNVIVHPQHSVVKVPKNFTTATVKSVTGHTAD